MLNIQKIYDVTPGLKDAINLAKHVPSGFVFIYTSKVSKKISMRFN